MGQMVGGDIGDHQILVAGNAHFLDADLRGERGQAVQHVGGQIAQHRIADHGVAAVMLLDHAHRGAFDGGVARLAPIQLFPRTLRQGQQAVELFLEQADELLRAEALHDELDARLVAVDAIGIALMDAGQRLHDGRQLLLGDEGQHLGGRLRLAAQATADEDAETLLAILFDRDQAEIVETDAGAIGGAARDRRLDLARHVLHQRVADPAGRQLLGDLARVDMLARAIAGQRAGGDVAEGVAASLTRRHAVAVEIVQRFGRFLQRHVIGLDVLAGGDVHIALAEAAIEFGQRGQPVARQHATRDLDAHHLHARLLLAIDAEAGAKARPFVLVPVATQPVRQPHTVFIEIGQADKRFGDWRGRNGNGHNGAPF